MITLTEEDSRPSGRTCVEPGCSEPAGTVYGPYWCLRHDQERMRRLDASFQCIAERLGVVDEAL